MLRGRELHVACELEKAVLEELVDALESFAFSKLDAENNLLLAGCHSEAQAIASWRRGVRDAAHAVRTWNAQARYISAHAKSRDEPGERSGHAASTASAPSTPSTQLTPCPLCPRPFISSLSSSLQKCKWHK